MSVSSVSGLSPPSYALEIRDQYNEKEDFADSKCTFVTIDAGKPVEEVFEVVKSVFSSTVKNVISGHGPKTEADINSGGPHHKKRSANVWKELQTEVDKLPEA